VHRCTQHGQVCCAQQGRWRSAGGMHSGGCQ
jgi:hypothetical protein